MRIAVPDLISPSYFPAIAAVELGLVAEEGVDASLELLYPVTDAAAALRSGRIDVLAGAAHAPMHVFPGWRGVKLLIALSRNMYWFLVLRTELGIARGDLEALRDVRIGAAPGPDLGLRALLEEAGIDAAERGIRIGPVPGTEGAGVSFGVTAAEALAAGRIDGFWANGMGAEVAVRRGVGTVVVDARRGDGPAAATGFTFPALAVTEESIAQRPEEITAVARAVIRAQQLLRAEPERAAEVGARLFPPVEASMIAGLVRRDAPYYSPWIDEKASAALVEFGQRVRLLDGPVRHEDVVATEWETQVRHMAI
jgi:NitT/TauT family transport system substrate-binding protein